MGEFVQGQCRVRQERRETVIESAVTSVTPWRQRILGVRVEEGRGQKECV
jgi:hypothetical protein